MTFFVVVVVPSFDECAIVCASFFDAMVRIDLLLFLLYIAWSLMMCCCCVYKKPDEDEEDDFLKREETVF
jgi:hypothetical protein